MPPALHSLPSLSLRQTAITRQTQTSLVDGITRYELLSNEKTRYQKTKYGLQGVPDAANSRFMARPLIDVRDLEYFLAAYHARGFADAARVLGTVQSNVSARIKSLERRLGTLLFERRYRDLAPTLAGAKLFSASKGVLAALWLLERTMQREAPHRGHSSATSTSL